LTSSLPPVGSEPEGVFTNKENNKEMEAEPEVIFTNSKEPGVILRTKVIDPSRSLWAKIVSRKFTQKNKCKQD
jgi:hypothetical protein